MQKEIPAPRTVQKTDLAAAKRDRDETNLVGISEGKHTNGEEIYTEHVAGCIVTVAYMEYINGRKAGILLHYPRSEWTQSLLKLCELTDSVKSADITKHNIVVIVPEGLSYLFEQKTLQNELLHRIAESTFGGPGNIEILKYKVPQLLGIEVMLRPSESEFQVGEQAAVKF